MIAAQAGKDGAVSLPIRLGKFTLFHDAWGNYTHATIDIDDELRIKLIRAMCRLSALDEYQRAICAKGVPLELIAPMPDPRPA